MVADVDGGPDILADLARFIYDWPAHTVNIFEQPVRQYNPEIARKPRAVANCNIENLLNKRAVFRMKSFQKQLEVRRIVLRRIVAEDSGMLL